MGLLERPKEQTLHLHLLRTTISRLESNDLVTVVVIARSRGVETVEDKVSKVREGE